MNADLTDQEARDQFELWTSKALSAREASEKYDRLARGYDRMVEGLTLIFPKLASSGPVTIATSTEVAPTPLEIGAASVEPATAEVRPVKMRTEDAVLAVLEDVRGDAYYTAKGIAESIAARDWVLDSDEPETVIRKYLNRARQTGVVTSKDLDGRTKGYRIPDMTPGDTAGTVPPGSVTTTRPGGDGHAEGPDVAPDHDPTFGGRDDRDQHRETATSVAVDF